MEAIETHGLMHRYGRVLALTDVDLTVRTGSLYVLVGPNGSGKTTLLQILAGLRRPSAGHACLLGRDVRELTLAERSVIGYVAEGQRLPEWMTLHELEAYLSPLYSAWDHALAKELRKRFRLDDTRPIRTFSRGEKMKAALLCTLAPRPRLLLMDEPFTGMDVVVKDELVRGLLEYAGSEGWTVLLCSHDVGELEALGDWIGFLHRGLLRLSEPMETLRDRFQHVTLTFGDAAMPDPGEAHHEWLSLESSGPRLSFITSKGAGSHGLDLVRRCYPHATNMEFRPASLREVFVALANRERTGFDMQEVAR